MELRHLEYFLMVCETGSLNAAAKKLYISQQALSKNMDTIEQGRQTNKNDPHLGRFLSECYFDFPLCSFTNRISWCQSAREK